MPERGHVHSFAKGKATRIDQCHFTLVVRPCSDCGETVEVEVPRDFHKNPMQVVFAREDCAVCRRLTYGIEPASWGATQSHREG